MMIIISYLSRFFSVFFLTCFVGYSSFIFSSDSDEKKLEIDYPTTPSQVGEQDKDDDHTAQILVDFGAKRLPTGLEETGRKKRKYNYVDETLVTEMAAYIRAEDLISSTLKHDGNYKFKLKAKQIIRAKFGSCNDYEIRQAKSRYIESLTDAERAQFKKPVSNQDAKARRRHVLEKNPEQERIEQEQSERNTALLAEQQQQLLKESRDMFEAWRKQALADIALEKQHQENEREKARKEQEKVERLLQSYREDQESIRKLENQRQEALLQKAVKDASDAASRYAQLQETYLQQQRELMTARTVIVEKTAQIEHVSNQIRLVEEEFKKACGYSKYFEEKFQKNQMELQVALNRISDLEEELKRERNARGYFESLEQSRRLEQERLNILEQERKLRQEEFSRQQAINEHLRQQREYERQQEVERQKQEQERQRLALLQRQKDERRQLISVPVAITPLSHAEFVRQEYLRLQTEEQKNTRH